MNEFLWLSPKAPPRGFRDVPPGGFCVSVFLLARDAEGRLLAGRYAPDHPELERLTGMDETRRHKYAQGFTLPARHLRIGEPPDDAARAIARDLVHAPIDAPRLLRAWAESYELATYAGHTHHDLLLAYEARATGAPGRPPWYDELRYVHPRDVAWARGHDDVLDTLGAR